jgi:uncharacterized protein (DUF1810 family)
MSSTDPFDLQRFADAQDGVFETVLAELRAGRKRSHWIWFVFPQLSALGRSATARHFGISGLPEARAYLDHPVLGPRLRECTRIVNNLTGLTIEDIFGYPDYLKVRSSMTLFARCAEDNQDFLALMDKYYGADPDGPEDPLTVSLLQE